MSYRLYITRADHWLQSQEHPITLVEWRNVVEIHPTLRRQSQLSARNPRTGEVITIELREGAVMDGDGFWLAFHYDSGRIEVNCHPDAVPVVSEIAARLNAAVQGEEGERYDSV